MEEIPIFEDEEVTFTFEGKVYSVMSTSMTKMSLRFKTQLYGMMKKTSGVNH